MFTTDQEQETNRPVKRRVVASALMAVILAAGLLATVAASPASAARPPTPANVSATVGDVEATITWDAAGSGESCYTNDWFVVLTNESDGSAAARSAQLNRSENSWHVAELSPSTTYRAYVYAHTSSTASDCSDPANVYSAAGETSFTTNASNASGDPSTTAITKRAPRRVRNLTVTPSGTSATVTWDVPAARGNNLRCSAGSFYSYKYKNLSTGEVTYLTNNVGHHDSQRERTATLTGLTSGTRYRIKVYVYGSEDNCPWSRARIKTWTQ